MGVIAEDVKIICKIFDNGKPKQVEDALKRLRDLVVGENALKLSHEDWTLNACSLVRLMEQEHGNASGPKSEKRLSILCQDFRYIIDAAKRVLG